MSKFVAAVKSFVADENGVTAIEYALIAAVVGVGLVVALGTLRDAITGAFRAIGTALNTAATGS